MRPRQRRRRRHLQADEKNIYSNKYEIQPQEWGHIKVSHWIYSDDRNNSCVICMPSKCRYYCQRYFRDSTKSKSIRLKLDVRSQSDCNQPKNTFIDENDCGVEKTKKIANMRLQIKSALSILKPQTNISRSPSDGWARIRLHFRSRTIVVSAEQNDFFFFVIVSHSLLAPIHGASISVLVVIVIVEANSENSDEWKQFAILSFRGRTRIIPFVRCRMQIKLTRCSIEIEMVWESDSVSECVPVGSSLIFHLFFLSRLSGRSFSVHCFWFERIHFADGCSTRSTVSWMPNMFECSTRRQCEQVLR